MICGSPRTGTALLVAALFQPPKVVTVMEPWDAMRLPPADLFASFRSEIADGALRRGRLDIATLVGERRVAWCRDGSQAVSINVKDDYMLGIKFPAFWRYLDLLPETKFLVCLRDPIEVTTSYRETGGRLGLGLDYDIPFNQQMNDYLLAATRDTAERRVLMYDYINQHILAHLHQPNVLPVRYERWFVEPENVMQEIGDFLGVSLDAPGVDFRRAKNKAPSPREMALLLDRCTISSSLGYALGSHQADD